MSKEKEDRVITFGNHSKLEICYDSQIARSGICPCIQKIITIKKLYYLQIALSPEKRREVEALKRYPVEFFNAFQVESILEWGKRHTLDAEICNGEWHSHFFGKLPSINDSGRFSSNFVSKVLQCHGNIFIRDNQKFPWRLSDSIILGCFLVVVLNAIMNECIWIMYKNFYYWNMLQDW